MTAPIENALDRAARFLDAWDRRDALPGFARRELTEFVRQIVLDAARCCRLRAQVKERSGVAQAEATKCADAIVCLLLCRDLESPCISCNGEGCDKCGGKGVI